MSENQLMQQSLFIVSELMLTLLYKKVDNVFFYVMLKKNNIEGGG